MWEKWAFSVTNHKIIEAPWSSFLFYFSLNFFFTFLQLNPDLPTQVPSEGHACSRAWPSPQLPVKVFPVEESNILAAQKALANPGHAVL